MAEGKLENAERVLKPALEDAEKSLGPNNPQTLRLCYLSGETYYHQDRFDEAEELLKRASWGFEKSAMRMILWISMRFQL